MTAPIDVCERVLERVDLGVEAEVTVTSGTDALTRFATGFIHQNVASEVNHVLIRVALDGRNASTSVDGPADDKSLGRWREAGPGRVHGLQRGGVERRTDQRVH